MPSAPKLFVKYLISFDCKPLTLFAIKIKFYFENAKEKKTVNLHVTNCTKLTITPKEEQK